ncbi:hypothetical protein O5274_25855, partial [Escherichia coli]|nr:hypothetical protein [Escherichia coli]
GNDGSESPAANRFYRFTVRQGIRRGSISEESWEVPAVSAARREDPYFKASYDNVDYSQIPAGFRG